MTVLRLRTADGVDLAAQSALPEGPPVAATVLLHPHPLMGGDMFAPVPQHLFEELPRHGVAVLRFDFRGAGSSEGDHGGGDPEVADVRAAAAELAEIAGMPVWLVGWSFGADVSLMATDDTVAGWVAIAPPLRHVGVVAAGADLRPKHLLVPEHDQFTGPGAARDATSEWVDTDVRVIDGADHFLGGRLSVVTDLVLGVLSGER
jgi:alpha/beta superfamily hydrolase